MLCEGFNMQELVQLCVWLKVNLHLQEEKPGAFLNALSLRADAVH